MCLLVLNVQKCALTRWPVQPLLLFLDLGLDLVSLLARSFLAPEEHACSCLSLLYVICTGSRMCRVVSVQSSWAKRNQVVIIGVGWTWNGRGSLPCELANCQTMEDSPARPTSLRSCRQEIGE